MDVLKEKLREFYMKQHTTMLSVRKTASNCLLVEKRDGKKMILARFNISLLGVGHAWNIAMVAMSTLAYEKAKEEMLNLEKQAKQTLVALGTLPTDAEGMEMPLKDFQPAAKPNPLGDLFDMGRTASESRPLE